MRPADAAAVAAACVYAVVVVAAVAGVSPYRPGPLVVLAPLLLVPVALLRRRPLSRLQAVSLGTAATISGAVTTGTFIAFGGVAVAAIPAAAVAALACARFPTAALVGLLVLTGASGTLEAFFGISAPRLVDVLLLGLWLAAAWAWIVSGRAHDRVWLWPGIVCLAAYILLTVGQVLVADPLIAGIQFFRTTVWYLGVVLLIALAPWPGHTRTVALRAAVVLAGVAGAYATLRWAIGPAKQEATLAARVGNNFLSGELGAVGSFHTRKQLAAWMTMSIPFTAGMALVWGGRWRLAAALACGLCVVAMLAPDVRAGPAAAVPALAAVLLLFQLAQSFRGRRAAVVPIAVGAAALIGAGAFALTLGGERDSGNRYKAILSPQNDESFQGRLVKWRAALEDIDRAPLGHGLGTAGLAQRQFGRFVRITSLDVDSAYLRIAYEQGLVGLVLFAWALGLLLFGMARRAVTTLAPARAGPAIAGAGTLVAMLILFAIGEYSGGLTALWGWLLVGLGVAPFVQARWGPADVSEDGEPAR